MTSMSRFVTSAEVRYEATRRRLWRSPFFARVIRRDATRPASLARTVVVSILPCVNNEVTRLRSSARRWSSFLPSRLLALRCLMPRSPLLQRQIPLGELLLDLVDGLLA